jgi:hypothetical protein
MRAYGTSRPGEPRPQAQAACPRLPPACGEPSATPATGGTPWSEATTGSSAARATGRPTPPLTPRSLERCRPPCRTGTKNSRAHISEFSTRSSSYRHGRRRDRRADGDAALDQPDRRPKTATRSVAVAPTRPPRERRLRPRRMPRTPAAELLARESLALVGAGGVRCASLLHRPTSLTDGPEDGTDRYRRELVGKSDHDRGHRRVPAVSSGAGNGHGIHPASLSRRSPS